MKQHDIGENAGCTLIVLFIVIAYVIVHVWGH